MSLLESLNDLIGTRSNSFVAVQTTWNVRHEAPKAQTNTNSRNTAAAGSSGERVYEFQKEISRLDMKITKVATTVGTLYNQLNLRLRNKRKGGL